MRRLFVLFALLLALPLAACGGVIDGNVLRLDPGPDSGTPSPLVANDPEGPIPEPSLPPGFAEAARRLAAEDSASPPRESSDAGAAGDDASRETESASPRAGANSNEDRILYSLIVISPDAPELAEAFTSICLLNQLADTPLRTLTGLDQRMRRDLRTARDILHSHGYYDGNAHGKIQRESRDGDDRRRGGDRRRQERSYTVTVTFEPGERYTVAHSPVNPLDAAQLAPYAGREAEGDESGAKKPSGIRQLARRAPPRSLAEAGLAEGSPALADNVLQAVSEARELFRDRGYPFAKTASTRHTLDTNARTLRSEVVIDSGPLVFMGPLRVKGTQSVSDHYLNALRTWREGQAWGQRRIENFRDSLRQSGLFSAAEISPGEEETADGLRPVVVELTPAPERTIGGALKFDTDFGPGVQAYWEHRNFTGRGDSLRVEAPVWQDLQEIVASYRLPFFLRNDQDLISRAAFHHENTDAYEWTAATGSIGLERRLSRRWRGSLSVMGEGGVLKDPDESRQSYIMVGLPGTLVYDGTDNLLNATRGVRLNIAAGPYTGEYNKQFTVGRVRTEGQAFLPVIGEDSLVMAFRAMYGMVSEDADQLPASIRYYVGGGGSVRGYDFQSLGPRNDSRAPLGGASAVELSAEARVKLNDTWGVVAFVDGGMAYAGQAPDFSEQELRWGAGLGLRFFTAIGPVRLDVATPLNPRHKDSAVHVYFSIGQSF